MIYITRQTIPTGLIETSFIRKIGRSNDKSGVKKRLSFGTTFSFNKICPFATLDFDGEQISIDSKVVDALQIVHEQCNEHYGHDAYELLKKEKISKKSFEKYIHDDFEDYRIKGTGGTEFFCINDEDCKYRLEKLKLFFPDLKIQYF